MSYATFITALRNQVGDTPRRVHVDWTGDGSTTAFQMPTDTFPVLEGSYVVKVNGSTMTEGSQFTLDKNTGTIVFAAAPTNNHAVLIDASAVYLTDADWLEVINSAIRSLGNDYFKEFVNDDDFDAPVGLLSLDLSTDEAQCMAVYELSYRQAASADWMPVEDLTNWRYSEDENMLYFGTLDAFPGAGSLRVRGLRRYELGDASGDTVDVQSKYMTVVEYGCLARYYRWRYKSVIEMVSKMSTENTRTPLQELIMLSDRYDRLYEIEKGKLKPQKPARIIPVRKEGAGRP